MAKFEVSEGKARELIVQLGLDPDDYLKGMQKVKEESQKAEDAIEDIGKETEKTEKKTKDAAKEMEGAWGRLEKRLGGLGTVGKFVFGTVLGLGAIQAIRKVVDFLREAVTAALEFEKSVFTLEVAIRGLQRVGLDTTIQGWTRYLEDLKRQFPIFSEKEFIDAASLAALMTREFGFTEEQMQNIVKQSIILAQVTGKTLTESVRGITFAIGSGYFESLQRAGINISRQIIAEEALARGYEGSYTALNQSIRAMLTYEIVQNNINAIQDDAEKIMDTTVGQAQRLHASYQDLLKDLGLLVTETDAAKESLTGLSLILETIRNLLEMGKGAEVGGKQLSLLEVIFGPTAKSIMDALPAWNKALEEWNEVVGDALDLRERAEGLGDLLDTGEAAPSFTFSGMEVSEERMNELIEASEKLQKNLLEIEMSGETKRQDMKEDLWRDLENNWESHLQKMADIQRDYEQKLGDIDLKETRAIADEQIDYAFKVAEAARQAAFRKEEAERKYREREIQAEKRFQEKMRQLRENFLLNLEDAVRERDALQIIRLTRQYNLRKTQMERENKLSIDDRADAYQEQLRQIEQQRLERQRQLAIEHQRRLEDIAVQAERERAQAKVNFERRQEDERARIKEQQDERKEKFNEAMTELDEQIQERINKMVSGLQEEYGLSKTELEAIGELYMSIYGPGGPIDVAIGYAIARIAQLNALYVRLRAIMAGLGVTGPTPAEIHGAQHAEGGTVIASKPTTVTFGEAGPEIATFTPLSRAGVNTGRVTGNLPAGVSGRGGGKHVVGISLSPGLEGKIVNRTMDEMSEVLVRIERARL